MMEDLVIKFSNNSLEKGITLFGDFGNGEFESSISKKEAEKLRDWLDRALKKPRYKVQRNPSYKRCDVIDNKNYQKVIGAFYDDRGYDALGEAEKLCQHLNDNLLGKG